MGSILLAFAIDAWWDTRNERVEEREVLVGLESDFPDLIGRLNQWGGLNATGVRLIGQFLSDSLATLDRAVADSARVLSVATDVLDQGGPLEALFASGRLELIENRDIRALLGSVVGLAEGHPHQRPVAAELRRSTPPSASPARLGRRGSSGPTSKGTGSGRP